MVCQKCKKQLILSFSQGEKKLVKLSNPDVWKDGARNTIGGTDGGVRINENKLLSKKKATLKFDPYGKKCKDCKSRIDFKHLYCQTCAYKKGLCQMCGVKILNTKYYRQTIV